MAVALLGTFDVANYGDLLFPLVAARRLGAMEAVSPVGGRPFSDAVRSHSVRWLHEHVASLEGVLVGGGNIIHADPCQLVYASLSPPAADAYPSLWWGAARAAVRHGVPVIWNAPGVPGRLPPVARRCLVAACTAATLVSVRDKGSRRLLREAGFEGEVSVVPDTAFDVADLWTIDERARVRQEVLSAQGDAPERWFVVHLSGHRLAEDARDVARSIDLLAGRLDAVPVLMTTTDVGDVVHRVVAHVQVRDARVLVPRRLLDVVSVIEGAEAYLGASMHAAITAAVVQTPFHMIAAGADHKLAGLLHHLGAPRRECSRWADAPVLVDRRLLIGPNETSAALEGIRKALDDWWTRVRAAVAGRAGSGPTHGDESAPDETALLREMLGTAARRVRTLERRIEGLRQNAGELHRQIEKLNHELGRARAAVAEATREAT